MGRRSLRDELLSIYCVERFSLRFLAPALFRGELDSIGRLCLCINEVGPQQLAFIIIETEW